MTLPTSVTPGVTTGHLSHHSTLAAAYNAATGGGLTTTITEGQSGHGAHHDSLRTWYNTNNPGSPLAALPIRTDPSYGSVHDAHHEAIHAYVNGLQDPLQWSPAPLGQSGRTVTTLNLTDTGAHQTLNLTANVDYIINLPNTPLDDGLTILGGYNIRMIGGQINMMYPGNDSISNAPGIYLAKSTPGEVFIEGVWIKNPGTIPAGPVSGVGMPYSTGDGIRVDTQGTATPPTFVFQNVRVDGVSGLSALSATHDTSPADHADILQPYQAGGSTFKIDRFTGTSNCQGFQIDPDMSYLNPPNYDLRRVNLRTTRNPYSGTLDDRYLFWFTGGPSGGVSGTISLSEVYGEQPSGSFAIGGAWPDTDQPVAYKSVWNGTTKQLSFPNTPNISGVVKASAPAGGDFVVAGANCGIGYVSPGYLT